MRFSVLFLALFVLFVSQCVHGGSSAVQLEVTENNLIRRQTTNGSSTGGHSKETQAGATTSQKSTKSATIWASPPILQNGTLFYIAISISALLWCTGKGVDLSLDQQERQAEYQAHR